MTGYRYSVLRFLPTPDRQEFVNVGVVVMADGEPARVRVSTKRAKARCLGYSGDLTFLDSVRSDLASLTDPSALDEVSRDWGGSIRLSEPRGAIHASAAGLCDDLFERYVVVPTRRASRDGRDRNDAKRLVRQSLRQFLPPEAVALNPNVQGQHESHKFDVGVRNGRLLHAVSALSFEIKTDRLLAAEVDACAWAIADVRAVAPDLPVSVIAVGTSQAKLLRRAEAVYDSLGARVITERDLDTWALGVETEVAPHLTQQSVKRVIVTRPQLSGPPPGLPPGSSK